MTYEQFLLGKLAEECTEIAQDALKTQQFGFDSCNPDTGLSNVEYLNNELNDVFAILEMLKDGGYYEFTPESQAIQAKKEKVLKYLEYSKNLGRID